MKTIEDKLNVIDKKVDLLLYKHDTHLERTSKLEDKVGKILLGSWAVVVIISALVGPKMFEVFRFLI